MGRWVSQTVVIFGATVFMLLGFQNCAEVNFEPDSDLLAKGLTEEESLHADSSSEGSNLPDRELTGEGKKDSSSGPNDQAANQHDQDAHDEMDEEITLKEEAEQEEWLASHCGDLRQFSLNGDEADLQLRGTRGVRFISSVARLDVQNHRGNLKVAQGSELEAKNIRGNTLMNFAQVDLAHDIRGAFCLGVHRAESLSSLRGSTRVRGFVMDDQPAYLAELRDARGNVRIENMSVGLIENTRGNLRIINGNIGEIRGHKGSVVIENGSLGTYSGVTGSVRVNGQSF